MENEKSCKSCSAKKFEKMPIGLLLFSIYFLISAVYGTVEITKMLFNLLF